MKKNALSLIFFLSFISCHIYAGELETDALQFIEHVKRKVQAVTKNVYEYCEHTMWEQFPDRSVSKGTAIDANGKTIDISVVSEGYVRELFDEMAAQKHIPFGYPEDGCHARAHEMTRLLEDKGIIAAKVFVEGDLRVDTENSPKGYVSWWFHVAPILKVKKDGKEEVYVIDPSIFSEAVPLQEWLAIQTSHEDGRQDEVYKTRRFNYTPLNKSSDIDKYDDSVTTRMKSTMKRYLKIQLEREQKRKQGTTK